jgi:hypothetical protein
MCVCVQVKGNVFKNKRVLMEAVHKQKSEKAREKNIADQFEARRVKNKATRERKGARREERLVSVSSCEGLKVLGIVWGGGAGAIDGDVVLGQLMGTWWTWCWGNVQGGGTGAGQCMREKLLKADRCRGGAPACNVTLHLHLHLDSAAP